VESPSLLIVWAWVLPLYQRPTAGGGCEECDAMDAASHTLPVARSSPSRLDRWRFMEAPQS